MRLNNMNMSDIMAFIDDDCYELEEKAEIIFNYITYLEAKLAEKDEEIISLECVISEIHNDIKELHEFKVGEDEYDLTDSDARFSLQCDLLNNEQDKILFAVEQLMGVQKYISDNDGYIDEEYFGGEINEFIDNQIKQLKEGK